MALIAGLLRKYQKWIKILIPFAIFAVIYLQARDVMRGIRPEVAAHLLLRLNGMDHIRLLAASVIAISLMSGYDVILTRMAGHRFRFSTLWRVGWIANSFNNMMGFAGLTGSSLRLMLYRKRGLPSEKLVPKLIFLSASMLTGLSVLSVFTLLDSSPVRSEFPLLLIASVAIVFYLPVLAGTLRIPWISRRLGLDEKVGWLYIGGTVLVSILEWTAAAWVFWNVCGMLHIGLSLRELAGLFGLAAAAGVISMLPGGAGSFDIVMLAGLQTYGVDADRALAVLLLYRIFYYFIPFLFGLMLASFEWLPQREAKPEVLLKPVWNKWRLFWNWPGKLVLMGVAGNTALAALVFSSGFILLMSAALPSILDRSQFLHHWFTLHTMKVSHHFTVLVGLLLIVLSNGIRRQVRRAYYATLVLLAAGVAFSLAKGLNVEEAAFLVTVFIFLWMSKDRFRRKDIEFTRKTLYGLLFTTIAMTFLYILVGLNTTPDSSRWFTHHHLPYRYLIDKHEHWRAGIIALFTTWLSIFAWLLLRPGKPVAPLPDGLQMLTLREWLNKHHGNFVTHLLFLGDKSLFWTQDGKALIAYRRTGRTLVALGDPIGERDSVRQAVLEFRQYADSHACKPVFYQVRPENLPLYHENGFRFFKLGEEGVTDVRSFQLTGRSKSDLRAVKNRYEREGYTFEIAEPPFSSLLMDQLRGISDEWLEGRPEKGFSLGWFKESYLQLTGIALLRDPTGRILAFANLMPSYDDRQSVSIDLMRYRHDSPNGIMDCLFLHLLEWSKSQGFSRFNLGMAPLANVGESAFSHRSERLAHEIYRRANRWYRFAGIRRYKDKFDPQWEPRFLAYPGGASLPFLIWRITRMIAKIPSTRE
ncbi:bifunctional lysylphosphatidylglycerol flippase/synthetase MprF [Cohnella sp. AR92]|uniref:bifunctional lysylphosphatidylglycerol flippase/synthetase MprF n=1 Tax=Cohnella sp. AR92 TaxID=648716 RepID=UPI0013153111|nr:bifunctional lysylphosphatidylglycerol flippase/synthetase MprF [Cohnella sp. AR92]